MDVRKAQSGQKNRGLDKHNININRYCNKYTESQTNLIKKKRFGKSTKQQMDRKKECKLNTYKGAR